MKATVAFPTACMAAALAVHASLKNPDFETVDPCGRPAGWYSDGSKWRVLPGEGMNGSNGLVFENRDGVDCNEATGQRIAVEPGGVYRFGAWVKVDEIPVDGEGRLVMFWRDANGKWLGQTQGPALRRVCDWTKIEAITVPIPASATTGMVQLHVKHGTLGRVVFDRAYAEHFVRSPVVGTYCSAYRSEASDGNVDFAAALTPEAFGKTVKVRFEVKRADGTSFKVDGRRVTDDEARTTIGVDRFALGTNEVTCVLASDDCEIGRSSSRFVRTKFFAPRRVFIDRHGRTVVDGKPFFPLGMYAGRMDPGQIARYADSPFNCLMQYGSPTSNEMEAFRKAGLMVIYDISNQYQTKDCGTNHVCHAIGKFKKHPSLLAWYLHDEQPTSQIPLLEARQRLVEKLDPDHPTWCVQDVFIETRHYIGACDIFGGDPYPVSARPVSVATDAMRMEVKGLMGMRPVWQVVQAFGWNWIRDTQVGKQRRPTEAEIRNMAWQALAGGARGLVFYSYGYYCRDMPERESVEMLWPEMKRIAAEIKRYEAVLLAAETSIIADTDLPSGVVGRRWRTEDGKEWHLLVNTSASIARKVYDEELPPLGVSIVERRSVKDGGFLDHRDTLFRP